jgi:uracil-DNA glycosylase family 4
MNMTTHPPCDNPCKDAFSYSQGIKGVNADLAGILFVLNRADSRLLQQSLFNNAHLEAIIKTPTGKALDEILRYCNLSFDDVYITNLFKCLLPGDRSPRRNEYRNCTRLLEQQVDDFKPRRIVAFGNMAYAFMFPGLAAEYRFETRVGQAFAFHDIPTLISHHPSKLVYFPSENKRWSYEKIKEFLTTDKVIIYDPDLAKPLMDCC